MGRTGERRFFYVLFPEPFTTTAFTVGCASTLSAYVIGVCRQVSGECVGSSQLFSVLSLTFH